MCVLFVVAVVIFLDVFLKIQVHIFNQNGINVNILLYVLSFHIS